MKTQETLILENAIYAATEKMGVFGCFEVTIGWFGHERVDYMTFDTKGIWRCFELKVSKADFHSKAAVSFVGHLNYYVMPLALYEDVKSEIPEGIGVYTLSERGRLCLCEKRAKKRELAVEHEILVNSMIRSLSRDADKLHKMENPKYIESLKRDIRELEEQCKELRARYDRDTTCFSCVRREHRRTAPECQVCSRGRNATDNFEDRRGK